MRGHSSTAFCEDILAIPIHGPYVNVVQYLPLFGTTLLLESLIYVPALVLISRGLKKAALASLIGNAITHIPLYWITPFIVASWNGNFLHLATIGELWAIIGEWLVLIAMYRGASRAKLLLIAVVANLASWISGIYLLS